MKVGDLVMCPECYAGEGYIGLIVEVCGHKMQILGGPSGLETWDMLDLDLLASID